MPSLRFGRNQKNSLDIQLVIDALDVAYTNPLIDSFCIVSGDSDYVPLVGKLKTMGKFVLGISRSEAASSVFMNACSEFQFLESVASGKERAQGQEIEALTLADVNDLIVTILKESDSGEMLASEVKSVLLRLRPNFSEKSVGFSTFGKLIARLSQQFGAFSGGERAVQRHCVAQPAARDRRGADHAGELHPHLLRASSRNTRRTALTG